MPKRFFILVTAIIISLGSVSAQGVDYTVRNLAVDVEGESAIDAREKALNQARSNAFNVLKKRISSQDNTIPTPDAATISAMVNSFEINREKLAKNRYLASVNVSFNEREVQNYIGRYSNTAMPDYALGQQPFGQTPSQPVAGQYAVPNAQGQMQTQQTQYPQAAQPSTTIPQRSTYSGPVTQSLVKMDLSGIGQWIGVKKMLESLPIIQSVNVQQISARQAVINLAHRGSINELQSVLMGRGMQLYSNTNTSANAAPYILITRG